MLKKSMIQRITKQEAKRNQVRFSKASVEKLTDVINEIGEEISEKAKILAEHAGRNIVNEKDIRLVLK